MHSTHRWTIGTAMRAPVLYPFPVRRPHAQLRSSLHAWAATHAESAVATPADHRVHHPVRLAPSSTSSRVCHPGSGMAVVSHRMPFVCVRRSLRTRRHRPKRRCRMGHTPFRPLGASTPHRCENHRISPPNPSRRCRARHSYQIGRHDVADATRHSEDRTQSAG